MANQFASHSSPGLPPFNQMQKEAVDKALKQPFTVIQGPPGTGKSALAAHLAFLFTSINRKMASIGLSSSSRQVMICGPSNKSVDVVASK